MTDVTLYAPTLSQFRDVTDFLGAGSARDQLANVRPLSASECGNVPLPRRAPEGKRRSSRWDPAVRSCCNQRLRAAGSLALRHHADVRQPRNASETLTERVFAPYSSQCCIWHRPPRCCCTRGEDSTRTYRHQQHIYVPVCHAHAFLETKPPLRGRSLQA